MFGMGSQGKPLFEFDMQRDFRENPEKAKKFLEDVDKSIEELKALLKKGASAKDLDSYGILLQGFSALKTVISRVISS